jgi:hypothetical protein
MLWRSKISCFCRESNAEPSFMQIVALSLRRLSYNDSVLVSRWSRVRGVHMQ